MSREQSVCSKYPHNFNPIWARQNVRCEKSRACGVRAWDTTSARKREADQGELGTWKMSWKWEMEHKHSITKYSLTATTCRIDNPCLPSIVLGNRVVVYIRLYYNLNFGKWGWREISEDLLKSIPNSYYRYYLMTCVSTTTIRDSSTTPTMVVSE